ALALAHQPEQQVFRADVVVVEPLRFVLRECQDLACSVGELVEPFHRVERPYPCCASSRRLIDASTRIPPFRTLIARVRHVGVATAWQREARWTGIDGSEFRPA